MINVNETGENFTRSRLGSRVTAAALGKKLDPKIPIRNTNLAPKAQYKMEVCYMAHGRVYREVRAYWYWCTKGLQGPAAPCPWALPVHSTACCRTSKAMRSPPLHASQPHGGPITSPPPFGARGCVRVRAHTHHTALLPLRGYRASSCRERRARSVGRLARAQLLGAAREL